MPDLFHTLQKHDLGFLRMVAGVWGIELSAPDVHTALPILVNGILNHNMVDEFIEALPEEAQNALYTLMQNEGRMPWVAFTRQFGELRRMGAARRDRERPDLKPAWSTEILWYRALIGRDFLDLPGESGPQEYAYIPEDLILLLPTLQSAAPPPPGRPATPNECAHPRLSGSSILDDTCTLLAALRLKMPDEEMQSIPLNIPLAALKDLLNAAHLLDYDGLPHPDRTRNFLEAPRGKAMAQLVQAWMQDSLFNELRLLPGLKFEGDWNNDPLKTREVILNFTSQVPENQWWNLASFVSAIHDMNPDFQRPAGDYDTWFIRQESSGQFLRGFGSWDEVDGALVRFLITGPMHWLGLLDLASSEPGGAPTAFRLSKWSAALWHGDTPPGLPNEEALLRLASEGRLRLMTLTPRAVRYQVARFCQWEGVKNTDSGREYLYRITPSALERAKLQGLRPSQMLTLLRRHTDGAVPPSLVQALERWEQSGTQAFVEKVMLLRVTSPEILATLRKGRANRFLGEILNETTVLVRPGMEDQLLAALAEAGYLAGARLEG
jgi:hypothetical protein